MSRLVQFKRGTTAQNAVYGGLLGELTVDTDKETLVLHDGAGGLTTMLTESSPQTVTNKTLTIADNNFVGFNGDGLEIVSNELGVDDTVVRTIDAQSIGGIKTFTDPIAVNVAGGITTDQESISLFNSNAEVVNFAGDAVDLQIGSAGGTTTINNNLSIAGNFTVAGTFTSTEEQSLVIEDKQVILANTASPNDSFANGGGIVLKGTVDKTILWLSGTNSWTSTEHFDLEQGKSYYINANEVLSETALGSVVANSSLQSVGTLTAGTWEADTIAAEYGGTGHTTYTDGELLIGNSTGNTLSKGTLTAGTGMSVTNGGGSITVTNTDRGSSQFIFKNIADGQGVPQIQADSNSDILSLEAAGSAYINFDAQGSKITIGAEGEEYTAGTGLTLDSENVFSVDNSVVLTSGNQTIAGTKTFDSTISGDIDGNAATASRLDPGAFINGVFFDGSENINLPAAVLEENLLAGDGIASSGPYNGSTERTFINSDKGSDQPIFKNIQNGSGVTQFTASGNSDFIRFAAGGDLQINFDSTSNQIEFSLEVPEGEIYLAGDGLDLTGETFSVDNTVVRTTDLNQTIDGVKTFVNPVELTSQATSTTQAVRADRFISTGFGVLGGSTLDSDINLEIDTDEIVSTTGNQTIAGTKTFVNTIIANSADPGIVTNTLESTNASFDLINANVGTINFGGGASEINIGNTTGQTNFAHDVNLAAGNVYQIDNKDVLSSDTLGSDVINSSLSTVGIITTGTWQGSAIQEAYGGTGETTYTDGQILIGDSSTGGLTKANITAGTNIGIDNANGSITINGPEYTAGNGIALAGNEFSVNAGDGLVQESNGLAVDFSDLVRSSRALIGGDGIEPIGDLSINRTINVDNTVIRTTGGQTINGTLTVNDTLTADGGITANDNSRVPSLGVGTAASGLTGDIRATGSITAYYLSDQRLKENVKEIPNALESLDQIRGVSFDWTADEIARQGGEDDYFVRKNAVGVIAQEIEEILPEAVAERPDGYKAVKYELLVPLLIQGMKEQQEQIKMLQEKVEDLCQRL